MRAREQGFAIQAGRHYLAGMTDKLKRPRDANQLAKLIVDVATGSKPELPVADTSGQRKGGQKGGVARANSLTQEERSDISSKAAKKRWSSDH